MHDVKITSFLPNPGNKDNTWKDMTLGFPTKLVTTSMQSYR
jgi:hypothetical protein